MDQQKLLNAFNQTPAGRAISGKEALRNRLGRMLPDSGGGVCDYYLPYAVYDPPGRAGIRFP